MNGFLGGLGVVAAIIVFVVAHEAGHYFAAKATGMKVTEFFIGFGPRIWSFKRGETEYGVKPLPLGAYVRIVGMSALEDVDPEDVGRTYREKEFWKKSVVVLAGIAANFLLAFFIFFGLSLSGGDQELTTTVSEVVALDGEAVAAANAGVEPGDVIVAIDGEEMTDWQTLASTVAGLAGQRVDLQVMRDGEPLTLEATIGTTADPVTGDDIGFLGVRPETIEHPISVVTATGRAAQEVVFQIGQTFQIFGQIFRFDTIGELAGGIVGGDVDAEKRPISVVGLAQIGAQADTVGIRGLLFIMAAVNVVLGVINGLPLFPLDGGHFAVALFEKVTRRKVDIRALVPVAVLVIGALAFVGVLTIILDIVNPIELPS